MIKRENRDISILIKEILKAAVDKNTQGDLVKNILNTIDTSELIEALRVFYLAGLNDGKEMADQNNDNLSNLTIGAILERKISERRKISDEYIIRTAPMIRNIRRNGAITLKEVADSLSKMDVKTPFGYNVWHPATVGDVERKIARKIMELKTLQSRLQLEISVIEG